MTSLPFAFGFAPERWLKLIDTMLEKDSGSPKLHRLRIIVLVEADMNTGFKLLYNHRHIPHVEKMELVPREHFGNRKVVQALHCVQMKVLFSKTLRITREVGALKMNDAAGCYDCIVPSSLSIVMRRAGNPKSVVKTNWKVMRGMRRHVQMAHGVSENFYSDTAELRQYEEGQGKGSSPPMWLLLSSSLLRTLRQCSPGAIYECARRMITTKLIAYAYVDDKDLGITSRHWGESGLEEARLLTADMNRAAQAWERLLFASRGALEFEKYFWWLIYWAWNDGRAKPVTVAGCPGDIWLTDSHSERGVQIERKELRHSLKTLGVWVDPLGNWSMEAKKWRQMSAKLGVWLEKSSLARAEAERMY